MSAVAALALATFLAATAAYDTVLLQNGGRVVGTVVEENPATGVTVQIPGGQLRTIPPGEVFRIEYRDERIERIECAHGAPPSAPSLRGGLELAARALSPASRHASRSSRR